MKFAQVIAAALAVLLLLTQQVWAVDLSATAAVLMDCDTGQILYQKNADKRMRIASTTKILTALVVLEECGLRQEVTVMQRHMAEGSSMYLKPGERVPVETLLYGLLLCSGNDAALALADACGGEKQCIRRMNDLAGRIGMNSSHFENPNGLDGETQHEKPQPAAAGAGGLRGDENGLYQGSRADAGILRGAGRADAGGCDAAGWQRLGRPCGTVCIWIWSGNRRGNGDCTRREKIFIKKAGDTGASACTEDH